VREGGFYPSALDMGMSSERVLMCALGEMNIQGVSTRKVKAISEEWQIGKHYCAGKSFSCKRSMGISDSNLQKKGCFIFDIDRSSNLNKLLVN